jgi:LPS export ABC transporter protein LptC
MRLNKKNSRFIAIGLLIFVFFLVWIASGNKTSQAKLPSIELLKNPDGSFDASVVFGEFRKSESKDGQKQWEIYAKVGRYKPSEGKADLENPELSVYKEQDVIKLIAKRGLVTLEGTGLKEVEVIGDVVITSEKRESKIFADNMIFSQVTGEINSTGPVKIIYPQMVTKGIDLKGNINFKNFTILNDVETLIEPAKEKSKKK